MMTTETTMTIHVSGLIPARCFATLVLAIGSAMAAQTPGMQQPAQAPVSTQASAAPQPDVTATVDEGALDFVAHDKKNNPVRDIKAEHVKVTDNGAPEKLSGLHLVKGD